MKKILFMTAVVLMGMLFVVSASMATYINPVGGDGDNSSLQNVLNNITTDPAGSSSVNVYTDQLAADAYWSIAGGGYSNVTMVIQLAGWAPDTNFGVFSGDKMVPIFVGGADPGTGASLSIHGDGSVYLNYTDTTIDFAGNSFGYYIETTNNGNIFYSDTSKNADSFDHMVAFQGKGIDTIKIGDLSSGVWGVSEFALAFEDTYGGGDKDYQDLAVMVESVTPIPEPTTMLLLGLGLVGLAGIRRKFKG